ncbi:MAG: D-alanine--D-alanine ligase [Frankiales bacterium]|nr:D-alanine--D-alanine ligase [Frankiales bacterium]
MCLPVTVHPTLVRDGKRCHVRSAACRPTHPPGRQEPLILTLTDVRPSLRDALPALRARRVAVVHGPSSQEDALYLGQVPPEQWSRTALLHALQALQVPAEHLDPTSPDFVDRLRQHDLVLLNAHGPYGEDGRVQGLLDYLGLPYTGSGVLASAVGMDKVVSKALFRDLGLATPLGHLLREGEAPGLPVPVMLKAVDGGSSVGLELVEDLGHLAPAAAVMRAQGFDRLFLEEYLPGRSVTVSVMELPGGRRALPPLESVVAGEPDAVYDLDAKLGGHGAAQVDHRCPEDLGEQVLAEMTRGSERVFDVLGARGAIRVDFVVHAGVPFALEVNTCPGLQPASNLPVAAAMAGLDYEDVVLALLVSAGDANDVPW